MKSEPRLDERAAELRAIRERLRALEGALLWAEAHDPQLVELIRERAKHEGATRC